MYYLTLSASERKAIDWIGDRYRHGHELYSLLWTKNARAVPDDADWDDPRDIHFALPEHVAWQIAEIGEEDNWACFAPELVEKLVSLTSVIV